MAGSCFNIDIGKQLNPDLQVGDVVWQIACTLQILESLNADYEDRIEVGTGPVLPLQQSSVMHQDRE